MTDTVIFPFNMMIVGDWSEPHLQYRTISAGVAMNGEEQLVSALTARWEMSIGILINSDADQRSYRAMKTALRGRFNYLLLPIDDPGRITNADIGASGAPTTFDDGVTFDDGSTFAGSEPHAVLSADAAAGADTVVFPASYLGGAITAGVYFSVNGWMHLVEGWELDGSDLRITFSPPLREDAAEGNLVDFFARALWALADDQTGKARFSQSGQYGVPELMLIEPVGRRTSDAA